MDAMNRGCGVAPPQAWPASRRSRNMIGWRDPAKPADGTGRRCPAEVGYQPAGLSK